MVKHLSFYKKNYPRPQLVRDNWTDLNGEWDFAFDREGNGAEKGYTQGFRDRKITVPFSYQCKASGIGEEELCKDIWYSRTFTVGETAGKRVILHLEGCDYESRIWVNGADCGGDTGGYHRHSFDITEALKHGENTLVIRARDSYSKEQPRGKQRWEDHNFACWYIDTSGLYKSVWLETVNENYIQSVKITPDTDGEKAEMEIRANTLSDCLAYVKVSFCGKTVAEAEGKVINGACALSVGLNGNMRLWQVGEGNLYEAEITLSAQGKTDTVHSYFGMRKISLKNGAVLLNGKPLYQRLILDQGYWENTDLTPPCEEALEKDITDMLAMGFNGARKHQKVEDERYLYYADLYGYIVWGEMPSMYEFTQKSRKTFVREWQLAVEQQYSHPCIIVWVPFNESWGIEGILTDKEKQDYVNGVCRQTRLWDATRPVISNDGWEHTESDLLTLHYYTQNGDDLYSAFDTVEKCCADKYPGHDRGAFAKGYGYAGQPVLITEYGGTSFVKDAVGDNWGYGEAVKNDGEYLSRLKALTEGIEKNELICGFCYTQLSDVYQEVNGLLKFDRTPKEGFEEFRAVFGEKKK